MTYRARMTVCPEAVSLRLGESNPSHRDYISFRLYRLCSLCDLLFNCKGEGNLAQKAAFLGLTRTEIGCLTYCELQPMYARLRSKVQNGAKLMKTAIKGAQAAARQIKTVHTKIYQLKDDGTIPNNPELPVVIYQGAFTQLHPGSASKIEETLKQNGWNGTWRNGIYPYHHYHSTAHETLAIYEGSATVKLGGEGGILLTIGAGDVVVIPAGVAHKNLESSSRFAVIGAYPVGQEWDMCYGKPGERPRADQNIAKVPLPEADPIYGQQGPLLEYWVRDR